MASGMGGTASYSGACKEESAETGRPRKARLAASPDAVHGLGEHSVTSVVAVSMPCHSLPSATYLSEPGP